MRETSQIDPTLNASRSAWVRFPDRRLGQLLLEAIRPVVSCAELEAMEDGEPARAIEAMVAREAAPSPEPVEEATWDIARLFPPQGRWSEEEYLDLKSNRLVELSDGRLEVLPWATTTHQISLGRLAGTLHDYATVQGVGVVLFAPLPVRLRPGAIRMPDVVFMRTEHAGRIGEQYWDGADLVMEVVGDDDRRRDLEVKRREYAQAGIPEYWIVDPQPGRIVVLRLDGDRYAEHGTFERGQRAASSLLPGFEVDVTDALAGRP